MLNLNILAVKYDYMYECGHEEGQVKRSNRPIDHGVANTLMTINKYKT